MAPLAGRYGQGDRHCPAEPAFHRVRWDSLASDRLQRSASGAAETPNQADALPCLRGGLPSEQTRRASGQCHRRDRQGFPQREQAGGGGAPLLWPCLGSDIRAFIGPLVLLSVFLHAGTPDSHPSASLSVCMSSSLTICLTCSSQSAQSAQPGALPSVALVSFPAVFLTCLSGEPPRAGAGQLAPVVTCPALVAVPASPASSCLWLSTISQSARATIVKHIQPPLAMARPASCLVLPWLLMRVLRQGAS